MAPDKSTKLPRIPEKRFHRRIDCELPVELTAAGLALSAKTVNISCGGMFLPVRKPGITEKSHLTAVLTLPDQTRAIKLSVEVLRVVEDPKNSAEIREGVAVRFNELYNDNILQLDSFIKSKLTH